jgi:hypothetical protein
VLVQTEAGEPEAHSRFVLGENGGGWRSAASRRLLLAGLLLAVERERGVLIRGAELLAAWWQPGGGSWWPDTTVAWRTGVIYTTAKARASPRGASYVYLLKPLGRVGCQAKPKAVCTLEARPVGS